MKLRGSSVNTRIVASRRRYLLPAGLVVLVGIVGLFSAMGTARAAAPKPIITTGASTGARTVPGASTSTAKPPSVRLLLAEGRKLFLANCSSCHGAQADGTSRAPNLVGLGAATIDFWVSTGRMPLEDPTIEAARKPPRFNRAKTLSIVRYVTSLGAGGPPIPKLDLKKANMAQGASLFALNCASCHTITGAGDALANGAYAPTLHLATPTQVGEAIRTGPANMPRFGPGTLSKKEVNDIVAYVTGPIQHPKDPGGIGLGGIGPVAEGFIALLLGVGVMMLLSLWIGDRA
ncbi:MAG: c-type cytochrome [Actinomycetota bacterium]|jgi:ubiquinol-cytochrome c reductase cytochrome c subunit|nr:c-type cytochrome [Actinomycetota bacterium]